MTNRTKLNTCKDAERLYNKCVSELGETDYSERQDRRIEFYKTIYVDTMVDLNQSGIGGVLINGIFRPTDKAAVI